VGFVRTLGGMYCANSERDDMRDLTTEELERFWGYVEIKGDNECWPWTLKTGNAPGFSLDNHKVSAMRIMYKMYYGEEVPKDKTVLRSCGALGKTCINPRHFILVKKGMSHKVWWQQKIREAKKSVHSLAELAGYKLVSTDSGHYRVRS